MTDDRRDKARQRTFKGGRVNTARRGGMDCLIRNMTETGACLEIDSGLVPENEFRLVILPEFVTRNCTVTWRKPHKIGVRFVDGGEAPADFQISRSRRVR